MNFGRFTQKPPFGVSFSSQVLRSGCASRSGIGR